MRGYDKFSDRFRKSAPSEATPAKAANFAKVPFERTEFSSFSHFGGGAPAGDFSTPADVIAPQALAGDVAFLQPKDEPPYDEPCLARRGSNERAAPLCM